MHSQNRGQVGNCWFARRIPIADDRSLRAQHVKLGLASGSKIGMNKRCLLASRKCHRDMGVISIRRMGPDALVVLATDVSHVIRNDVQNLIEEMTSPVEDCSARYFGV